MITKPDARPLGHSAKQQPSGPSSSRNVNVGEPVELLATAECFAFAATLDFARPIGLSASP
jgi:hypothetical protein